MGGIPHGGPSGRNKSDLGWIAGTEP
jgi:hypothetical protein